MKKTILITGGSGLIGTFLTNLLLKKGYKVIVLTRNSKIESKVENLSYAFWDIRNKKIDLNAVQQADCIIHLAGAGVVDKKWTAAYKKEIVESRTLSSDLIIETLKNNSNKVETIVSASAIGWYGPTVIDGKQFVESDIADQSFLGETCRLWESHVDAAVSLNIRICKLRTGIVLSKDGGALAEFMKTLKAGLAAILGSGDQIISWIHIEDLCRMFLHVIENAECNGVYNAVAPHPVTNKNLTLSLAKIIRGRLFIPFYVPKFILKIMMGERSIEVLKSTDVSSDKIRKTGFTFFYPGIETALRSFFTKN